jgi:CheY-like chemotaxis protein
LATVLIVDDDPHPRLLYQEYLSDLGYTAIIAANGPEAVEIVTQGNVDVVILDIAMPGMDGIEVLSKLLDINSQLPVILNTAYGAYKEDFMTWAAEAYVTKSSNLGELRKQIEAALEKRGIQVPPQPPQE